MRKVMTAGCVVGALAAGAPGQVVDIDGRGQCVTSATSGSGVPVSLDAGVYLITPVGPPEGAFEAWNGWGSSASGCDPAGAACSTGWMHSYRVRAGGEVVHSAGPASVYSTATLALEHARATQMRVCASGLFEFVIIDSLCADNRGGVSVRIEPSPCPADLNVDGSLDFFDFLEFQDLFAAGRRQADFDCSGGLDFFDFLAFQNAFAAGC